MSRNIIKLARGTKSSIGAKLADGNLAEYEIVYATDTKEIGVVNTGLTSITWSGALDYDNIADNLRVVTHTTKGAMSAQDKKNLDTLMDILGSEQSDADQIVNTLREVLDAFENFPEGTDLLTKFTELDNDKLDKLETKVDAGTYTKVEVNKEGQVTAGTGLDPVDIPSLSASKITLGTLPVERGGTGATTFTTGTVLIGNGTGAISTTSRSGIDTRTSFPPSKHDHDDTYLKSDGSNEMTGSLTFASGDSRSIFNVQQIYGSTNSQTSAGVYLGLDSVAIAFPSPNGRTITIGKNAVDFSNAQIINTTIDGGDL